MQTFDALIIDSNQFSRDTLWQATQAEASFRNVKSLPTLKDALRHLSAGHKYDVVLFTSDFTQEESTTFIEDAKSLSAGREAAYVLVMKKKHQDQENVLTKMIDGTDGFLFEPINIDALRQVSEIATRVRKFHADARVRGAVSMVLKKVMPALFDLSNQRRRKRPGEDAMKILQGQAKSMRKLAKEHPQIYFDIMSDLFETAEPYVKKVVKYAGASERVKQRLAEK